MEYNLRKRHTSQIISPKDQSPSNTFEPLSEESEVIKDMSSQKVPQQDPGSSNQPQQKPKGKKEEEKEIPVIHMKDFSEVDMEEKLNLLMVAINKVNTNLHLKMESLGEKIAAVEKKVEEKTTALDTRLGAVEESLNDETEGALPRLRDAETSISDLLDRVEILEEEKTKLNDHIFSLKGVTQVNNRKIITVENKVLKLTTRSMQNNVLIHGLTGDQPKEQCKEAVLKFFREQMKMDTTDEEVMKAHRIGRINQSAKPRMMVVRCQVSLRERIFDYTKNLKDLKNDLGNYYSVSPQLPEPLFTQKRETREKVIEVKKLNDNQPDPAKKTKIDFKNGFLHLDGKPQKKHIIPPTVTDMYNVLPDTQVKIDAISLEQSPIYQEKGSAFTGYATRISSTTEAKLAYKKVKQLVPDADHIMMSYVFRQYSGYHDDGEHAAGKKLSSILADRNATNTAVFVTRVFPGTHIGPKRFIYIEKAAKEALNLLVSKGQ